MLSPSTAHPSTATSGHTARLRAHVLGYRISCDANTVMTNMNRQNGESFHKRMQVRARKVKYGMYSITSYLLVLIVEQYILSASSQKEQPTVALALDEVKPIPAMCTIRGSAVTFVATFVAVAKVTDWPTNIAENTIEPADNEVLAISVTSIIMEPNLGRSSAITASIKLSRSDSGKDKRSPSNVMSIPASTSVEMREDGVLDSTIALVNE